MSNNRALFDLVNGDQWWYAEDSGIVPRAVPNRDRPILTAERSGSKKGDPHAR
jgi:hypothetical protein